MTAMFQFIFSKIKENFFLLLINLKVKLTNLIEFIFVCFKYYRHFHFLKIDAALLFSYLPTNPFRLSKRFLLERGESDVYTYGETPLTTLDLISHICNLSKDDVVFELGCGRGRTCFWLNQFIGCTVVGIDYVPVFIEKGQKIKDRFHIQGVSFRLEDLFQADLTGATVIYLYGTCFSESSIDLLIENFKQLPEGTKIITVSYPLEYRPEAPFQIVKQFTAPFTWGTTDVYLQLKKGA
jgi:SAM-dependent methyltransferase